MRTPLVSQDIQTRLAAAPGWLLDGGRIRKTYTFKNFVAAVGFVNAVAIFAEAADHHPDLLLHGYNKVDVVLSTHEPKGITDMDFLLAGKIDELTR